MNNMKAVVATRTGKIEGTYEGGLYIFKGIPYASPPVGEMRWMPPQPLKSWDGIRPTKEFSPIAPQNVLAVGPIVKVEQPQDEDCLFLNVWTPGLDDACRPVMVWIHGGAFTMDSGSDPMYTDALFAKRGDVVFITINYRLGMLGFLRLMGVTGGKIPSTGNEGLMDQVAALNWIKDNIAVFGGDPDNITVFGESAGAMSIGSLMAMPLANECFHKCILESGAGGTVIDCEGANTVAENLLKETGIKGRDAVALRKLSTKQLLDMETNLKKQAALFGEVTRVTITVPVVDGEVIQDVPNKVVRKGHAKNVPVIIGTNLDEWRLFGAMRPGIDKLDNAGMLKTLESFLPSSQVPRIIKDYQDIREKRGDTVVPFDILSSILSDIMFRIPALELVEAQRDNGQRAYNYLFTWKSPVMGGFLGACHALEIGFVFGKQDPMFGATDPDVDKLSGCMQDAWLSFARTGDPSCGSIGKWPVYGKDGMTMIFDTECRIEAAPYQQERRIWDRWMPKYYPLP